MQDMNYDSRRIHGVAMNVRGWFNTKVGRYVNPTIAITLGSGLGSYGENIPGMKEVEYSHIGLTACGVPGHAGKLRLVQIGQRDVLLFSGRFHLYEGHDPQTVCLIARVAARLGVKVHIITCASGGINPEFKPGELVLISDHINLTGRNPLTGQNDQQFGTRFPDMSNVYDPKLRALAKEVGARPDKNLREGVYAMMSGPSYETPAEIRMLRAIGADMVGMSTALEAVDSVHKGMRVLGISCVTNLAAGIAEQPLSHEEVERTAATAKDNLGKLLTGTIEHL